MLKYYTSSAYRKTYQILEVLGLYDDSLDNIKPHKLGNHILSLQKTEKLQKKMKQKTKSEKSNEQVPQIQSRSQQKKYETYQRFLKEEMNILKDVKFTPIQTFKLLLYIHTHFLLVRQVPSQIQSAEIYQFLTFVMRQTDKQIEKYSKKQQSTNRFRSGSKQSKRYKQSKQKQQRGFFSNKNTKVRFQSQPKNQNQQNAECKRSQSVNSNASTTRSNNNINQDVISKQIFLLMNIIKPYLLYLQKILSIYQLYQQLIYEKKEIEMDQCWCIINFFKLIGSICTSFSFMGRYFYKEFSKVVYLLIQYFSKEIGRIYPKLHKFCLQKIRLFEHQFYQLCNIHSEFEMYHNDQIQISSVNIEELVSVIEEISKVNQNFFHIYLGKYFYKNLQNMRIEEPVWLQATSKQCDFLFHFYQVKNKIKTKAHIRSKQQITVQLQSLYKKKFQQHKQKGMHQTMDKDKNQVLSIQQNQNKSLKQNNSNCKQSTFYSSISSQKYQNSMEVKKTVKYGMLLGHQNDKQQRLKLKLKANVEANSNLSFQKNLQQKKNKPIKAHNNSENYQSQIYKVSDKEEDAEQTLSTPSQIDTFTFRAQRKNQKIADINNSKEGIKQ